MEKFIREMKSAARSLTRTKGYTLTVIITLSACIAVNVAIFAIVNSVLLRPIPVPNAQQIVLMSNRYPKAGVPDQYISSSGDYYDRLKYVSAAARSVTLSSRNSDPVRLSTPPHEPRVSFAGRGTGSVAGLGAGSAIRASFRSAREMPRGARA
jgi:hypothetical protein